MSTLSLPACGRRAPRPRSAWVDPPARRRSELLDSYSRASSGVEHVVRVVSIAARHPGLRVWLARVRSDLPPTTICLENSTSAEATDRSHSDRWVYLVRGWLQRPAPDLALTGGWLGPSDRSLGESAPAATRTTGLRHR